MRIENQENKVVDFKLNRAKKRVQALKFWYWSIPIYLVGTAMMIFLVILIQPPLWLKYVFLLGPMVWWIFFIIQGMGLFLPKAKLIQRWESKKIKQFINEAEFTNGHLK